MDSSSSSSSSSLLAILVCSLIFRPIFFVKSDEALISKLCDKTAEPLICSDCFKSDPSSKTADANGLALRAVACAKEDNAAMFESISELGKITPGGSSLKTILNDCISNTSVALQLYDGVSFNIKLGDYGTAKEIEFEDVIPFSNACLNEFNRQEKVIIPTAVLAGTEAVNKDIEVVMGILNNI